MSHFTVLVIGNNPEQSLAPYHEFECTCTDDQYVQEIDITSEILADIKERGSVEEVVIYNFGDDSIVSDESELDLEGQHTFGYAIVRDGELIKAVRRTNPNAKWDWYQLGGRWDGFFLHKSGIRTNSLKKGEIDFAGMLADKTFFSPYAIIHENTWISKGEMGWWGISNDAMTQEQWDEKVSELISELPNDTMLSLYDCHI
ncbi:hypothetical protein VZ50_003714 [Salmonella enterica subsp. enterica serovar Champaign]|nr:hypothetical protein [Salmonella enterica subsp. enterica serovar Champaign]